jgi:bacterial/archaeal transporter family protein
MNNAMLSIFAGLGGMFGWGVSDFFASISSNKIGHHRTFFWSQVAGLALGLFFIPIFGFRINLSGVFLSVLIIGSILYAVCYLLMYKAFEIGNISVVSSVVNMWAVWTILFSYVFLGQRLETVQWMAIAVLLIGIMLVSIKIEDLKNKRIKLFLGVKEALLAAVIAGAFWTISDYLSQSLGWLELSLLVKVGAIIFLLLFSFLGKKSLKINQFPPKIKFTVLIVGVLEIIAVFFVNYGLKIGDAILVTPISSALSAVTIILAIIFLKEKLTKIQAAGIFLVISGIILSAF